jgi:MFS superfamily sulfate permease-like transporter
MKRYFSNITSDLPAGLVVFLVALPLCLGIALASGATPFSGIIAGIVGGIVVGSISGSQLSVSGPAAGLTVIVLNGITTLGSFEIFLAAIVVAGILQILMSIAKLGILGNFFPLSVIKGMLAAIGLILILKQIPHFIGYDADFEGDETFYMESPMEVTENSEKKKEHNTFLDLWYAIQHPHKGALLIGIISLGILLFWGSELIQKNKWLKFIPAALMAVITGLIVNIGLDNYIPEWSITANHLVQVPVIQSFEQFNNILAFPDFSHIISTSFWTVSITIAVIASIESLLSIDAADKLDPQKRITPLNRELFAQGSGNIVSGLLGGLPVTAVIVRTTANISAGGKTKVSAISHGLMLIIAVITVPFILNKIPLSSLAAVLLMVGYKLTQPKLYINTWKEGFSQFLPFLITIIAILFTDLLIGIAIGSVIGLIYVFKTNVKSAFILVQDDNKFLIRFKKDASFLNKSQLRNLLLTIPENSFIIIDNNKNVFLDHDIKETIDDFIASAPFKNIQIQYNKKL